MRLAIVLCALLGQVAVAAAHCRIDNETGYSFTVTSGNVSNQRIGAHTSTTLAASGRVLGKSDDGKKTFGGFCQKDEHLVLEEKDGVLVLVPR